jgi:hypothetical protein
MESGQGAGVWCGKMEHSTGAIGLGINHPALGSKTTPMAPRTSDRFLAWREKEGGGGCGRGGGETTRMRERECVCV